MKEQSVLLSCPQCGGATQRVELEKTATVRGIAVRFPASVNRCGDCGLELSDVNDAALLQERMADAYRSEVGLLSGEEIRRLRQQRGLSQQALADELEVGIASIKRWETGIIQSKSMDTLLRTLLEEHVCNEHTGHRDFSIGRIRLVLDRFAALLGRALLKRHDKMLYAAKYLWYADMTAFRDLGRSITGATYAALPMGPQLNNYRDLVDEILKADPAQTQPLTAREEAIVAAVARKFPTNKAVFDASHREAIWQECPIGAIIPYSRAAALSGMPRQPETA